MRQPIGSIGKENFLSEYRHGPRHCIVAGEAVVSALPGPLKRGRAIAIPMVKIQYISGDEPD
jgi:hypothetical protein